MTKSPWVVCDAVKQEMRCNRCGDTEPMSRITGVRLDFAAKIMKAFVECHEDCEDLGDDKREDEASARFGMELVFAKPKPEPKDCRQKSAHHGQKYKRPI